MNRLKLTPADTPLNRIEIAGMLTLLILIVGLWTAVLVVKLIA